MESDGQVARAIARARDKSGLAQDDFAAQMSRELKRPINRRQISAWETGALQPRAEILVAAAAVAKVAIDTLLDKPAWYEDLEQRNETFVDRVSRQLEEVQRQLDEIKAKKQAAEA